MISKLKNIFSNKDYRLLIENFVSMSLLQGIGGILPLIIIPYLIDVLGLDFYGQAMFAMAFIGYFIPIIDYSFKIAATRDVAVHRHNKKMLSLIWSRVLLVKSLLFIVSAAVVLLTIYLYPPFWEERQLMLATLIVLLGQVIFPDWFFLGLEKMKMFALVSLLGKIGFIVAVFILMNRVEDYWLYPIFFGLSFIVVGVFGFIYAFGVLKLRMYWLKPQRISRVLSSNFPLFINQFFPNLYNNSNTFFLGLFGAPSFVAIYDSIKKVIDVLVMIISMTSKVVFPFFNRNPQMFSKMSKYLLLAIVGICMIPIIFKELIIGLLGIPEETSSTILILLSISVIGYGLYNLYGLNYFVVKRRDNFVMKNTLIGSLIGLLLGIPMIIYYGVLGAALNLLLARLIIGGRLWFSWMKDE